MIGKNGSEYRGLNKDIAVGDLDKEELECYNKLMEGINKSSEKEKAEVAHLMEICIETDEKEYSNCVRCGDRFSDTPQDIAVEGKKVYCGKCLKKMWGAFG